MSDLEQRTAKLNQGSGHVAQDEVVEELQASLEELRISQDELIRQNESLAEMQQRINIERMRYRELFDLAPEAIILSDADGIIREGNQEAANLLGVRQRYLAGKPLAVFLNLSHRKELRESLSHLAGGTDRECWKTELVARNHNVTPVEITVAHVKQRPGLEQALCWIIRPISSLSPEQLAKPSGPDVLLNNQAKLEERIEQLEADAVNRKRAIDRMVQHSSELEMRLQARNDELQHAQAELESLGRGLGRSLKKSSRVIEQLAGELEQKIDQMSPEQVRQYVSLIRIGSRQTGALAQRLTAFVELPKRPLDMKPVNVAALLIAISKTHENQLQRRDLNLNFPLQLPDVKGDPDLIRTLFNELVCNALKFTSKQEGAVVEIGVMDMDGRQTWFVRDNGVGFAMANGYRLFHPFQRLHADEYEGYGLGLAIAKRIIQRHTGEIWAEAQEGLGTTVYFTLG